MKLSGHSNPYQDEVRFPDGIPGRILIIEERGS